MTGSLRSVASDYLPAVVFAVAFSVALAIASMRDAAVNSRMLSPLYVPITLVVLGMTSHLFGPNEFAGGTASRLPEILLALWLCLPSQSVLATTVSRARDGAGGYNIRSCRESPTIACAREVLSRYSGVPVYSNGADVLWEIAGVDAKEIPRRTDAGLAELARAWPPHDDAILVWFRKVIWRGYLFSVDDLEKVANLTEIAQLRDGTIYWVSARRATETDRSE